MPWILSRFFIVGHFCEVKVRKGTADCQASEYNNINQLTETDCVSLPMPNDAKCANLAAIVLCGGRSARMGRDKATLVFGKETLLQRVCRLTAATAHPIVVVAASEQQLPNLTPDVLVIRDRFPDQGPMGGLLTGLLCLQEHQPEQWPDMLIWACTCDAPFVNHAVIQYLQTQLTQSPKSNTVTITHQGKQNPLAAVYRSQILHTAEALFASGERRALSLLEQSETLEIHSSELIGFDPELLFLKNINDQQQLSEARSRL